MKTLISDLLPPLLRRELQRLAVRVRGTWKFAPEGWCEGGYDSPQVAETHRARWQAFVAEIAGTDPLDITNSRVRPGVPDPGMHNTIMAYGYVLGRAAQGLDRVRVLDWGGGLGHYRKLTAALFPALAVDYTCFDLSHLVRAGRELQPDVQFTDSVDEVMRERYDLVLASASLCYSQHWREVSAQLASVCDGYVYVTRLPSVTRAKSFVVRQRAYGMAFCAWILNRGEVVEAFTSAGLTLEREFLIAERALVPGAPEDARSRGFLFRAAGTTTP